MPRAILHCDMNNCFASIETLLFPELKGKAIAVCGSEKERHGIVLAKSEEAKKFGVKTAETIWQAKQKCPELLIVPPHYPAYLHYSRLARKLYEEYTDLVEPFGLDECWLDVTPSQRLWPDTDELAYTIKERIKKEIGLTVSIGVSFNKVFAKLGSDLKKPDAITFIKEKDFREKLWSLPASALLGVGRATGKKLYSRGVRTIGELASCRPAFLEKLLGKNGLLLHAYANGRDSSRVMSSDYISPVKSIGRGLTCISDLLNNEEVGRVFLQLAQSIARRLRDIELLATGVQITIRESNLHFHQFQASLSLPSQSASLMAKEALELFVKNYRWLSPVRALTIRAINLKSLDFPFQYDIFCEAQAHEKWSRVEETVYHLRQRFGNDSVTMASLLQDLKLPKEKSEIVTLPSNFYR